MIDVHDLWEAKIKHVLKSPTWEYECNNDTATQHMFNKIPNLEYELLSAINHQQNDKLQQDELEPLTLNQGEDDYLPQMVSSPRSSIASYGEDDDDDDDLILDNIPPIADVYDPALFKGYSSEDDAVSIVEKLVDPLRDEKPEYINQIEDTTPTSRMRGDTDSFLSPRIPMETPDELTLFGSQEWTTQPAYLNDEEALSPITPVVDKLKKLSLGGRDGYCFTYVSDGDDEDDEDEEEEEEDEKEEVVESSSISPADINAATGLLQTCSDDSGSPLYCTCNSCTSNGHLFEQDSLELS